MMHQQASFSYAEVDGVQVIELPYGDRDLWMLALLPKHVGELSQLEATLSAKSMIQWQARLVRQTVRVYLPKFRLTEQIKLADVLMSMGMASAFDITTADFFGITDPGACIVIPLCLSEIVHKAFVEVNEKGTEAAAATVVMMPMMMPASHAPPPIPVFRADHPFVYMIRHNETGSILFMGRVMKPE